MYQLSLPKRDPLREIHTKFSYRLSIFSTAARLVLAFFVLRKREWPPISRRREPLGYGKQNINRPLSHSVRISIPNYFPFLRY